jgi:hypothetical protein
MPTQGDDIPGVWRDEERLPLSELVPAVATSAEDGQDDTQPGQPGQPATGSDTGENGDPDPDTAAGRSLRPDFTGPTGPN